MDNMDTATKRPWWRGPLVTVVGLAFIGFMAGGIATLHWRANAEAPATANPPVAVAVQTVRLSEGYSITERFAGRMEPARQTRLSFERGGLIVKVMFEEGDAVNPGAVVARLDTAKLRAERDRLLAGRKELQARQALAKATLERRRVLASKGWQSAQKHDEARYNFAETSAAIDRLNAAIASIDVDVEKSVLKAPYAGTVAARLVDEGTVVEAGTMVVELMESGARQARVGVAVEAARTLRKGQAYRLSAGGGTFPGLLISKRPDLQTGTRTVTVLFEAEGGDTVPFGEIVELVLDRRIAGKGTWVPLSALNEGRKGLWSVLAVAERIGEITVAREAVELLHVDDGRAFVRGTIADGASIVINGTNRIIPGQTVALAAGE